MSDTIPSGALRKASGRFVVRLDPGLHSRLREEARDAGISLNDLCVRKLSPPGASLPGPAQAAVRRAADVAGNALLGVVAFGSWARGEMVDTSDVDVLLILDGTQEIHRDLYRSWDETPVSWDGRPVNPAFVHLPPPDAPMSGFWAEVAVDGIVIYERDLLVSNRLAEFRREIASGTIERRHSHGHPYWVTGV